MQQENNENAQNEDQQPFKSIEDFTGRANEISFGNLSNPFAIYRIIGITSIIFGVIIGIYLLITFGQSGPIPLLEVNTSLTFGEFILALGVTMLFVVPGVICIGVGKIIELLDK